MSGCGDLGYKVNDRPVSYTERRFEATIPQREEFTCGAASIATILTFYWNQPTTEAAVLATLKGRYSEKQIQHISETGLSFDDLVYMNEQLGFSAQGGKVNIAKLANLAGPVIVHLNKGDLKHFVVLRKVGDDVYYVSDPVVGELAMSAGDFQDQFTGYILAIWRDDVPLRSHTMLTNPRDGIRVADGLWRVINVPTTPFSPGL
jgi:uncharacterized protein